MIDSHCHLADSKFDLDLPEVITRAKAAGVDRMICIGDSVEESEKCVQLATEHQELFATVGVHPHNAKTWTSETPAQLERLVQSSPKVRAIGEIGLDYHYDFSPPELQGPAFASQLSLARKLGLPAVVHCREAVEDVWAIVREFIDLKVVIHCCTEKWEDVERFVDTGHFLSFTGIATYTNGDVVRDCIQHCPIDQLMIETDAPYLAPIPHRGKRNEPAFVVEVAKLVAELKGMSLQEVDAATTNNAEKFFGV